jgi:hypothetical protein
MASGPNNRNLTIILAIGGVVIALFAAYSLFSGGGGSGPSTLAPPSTQSADAGPHGGDQTIPSTTTPGQPNLPNGQFDVFATRNPFEPAVEVTPVQPDTGSTTGGTSTPPDTTPAAGTDTTTTVPASQNPTAGTTVAVIDVFPQGTTTAAVVQVGSTQYTVVAGQVFATSYKVVSLSGTCGQFMFGDSPFTLCEGQQVIK